MRHNLPPNIRHTGSMSQDLFIETVNNRIEWYYLANNIESDGPYYLIVVLVWKTASPHENTEMKRGYWGVINKRDWIHTDDKPLERMSIIKDFIRLRATLEYKVAKAYFGEDEVTIFNYDDREDPIWIKLLPR